MQVEIAYALPHRQWLRSVEIQPGTTAAEAVEASGIVSEVPDIDPYTTPLGVFGRRCSPQTVLRPGDRVEIYRPLQVDPREARRRRAQGSGGSPG